MKLEETIINKTFPLPTYRKSQESTIPSIETMKSYRNHLNYFKYLIEENYLAIVQKKNLDEVRECTIRLVSLTYDCNYIITQMNKSKIEGYKSKNGSLLETNRAHLEEEIAQFIPDFQNVQKEVIQILNVI